MSTLNDEIVDVFSLVGLLLVFVFAYFSGVWQQAESEMAKRKVSDNFTLEERRDLLRRQLWLMIGLNVVIVLIVAILAPLFIEVLGRVSLGAPFDAVRAGLILVITFLLGMFICVCIISKRINNKVNEINGWITENK
ncbi:hypothetical protein OG429_13665 [Streptomyces sp. NBC_00190]|uniref:hypothetical protein n=1 Tax=Streptomyces sp. NBC_00190 TaxID=2903634 RepID=UPI002E2A9BEF|nr:hypothetical protein [Streptomyces sp. NBC_00190]